MEKWAYIVEPHVGGIFSFFRRVRPVLREHGIDLRCLSTLPAANLSGTAYERMDGIDALDLPSGDAATANRLMVNHLVSSEFRGVIIMPGTAALGTNIVRYLPRQIRAVARVPMFARGAYAPIPALRGSLNGYIAVCDRISLDLQRKFGIDASRISVIYNGVDVPLLMPPLRTRKPGDPFRICLTGRLVDSHKGIFMLPGIAKRMVQNGVDVYIDVVGDGPDAERLHKLIQKMKLVSRVKMHGEVPPDSLHGFLLSADAYVLPTRYEGCPNSVLEAMAAGRPCVVSALRGSTDVILSDSRSGFLCSMNDVADFSAKLIQLAKNPVLCQETGHAAWQRVRDHYSIQYSANRYQGVLRSTKEIPDQRDPALSCEKYYLPSGMALKSWRRFIPGFVKNAWRSMREKSL